MISTGLEGLDNLLGGGVSYGMITDIFGPGGSGKTQLAMQICVHSQQAGSILFQDIGGGFRPERMLQLIKARNLDEKILDKIIISRPTNSSEQIEYLQRIPSFRPAMVVIDNITDLFSFEYSKSSSSLEKHIRFMEYMRSISLLAISEKIPVIITNMVRQSNDSEKESLDKSISMFTHRKIHLSKSGTRYTAEVLPSFGNQKITSYQITSGGLVETT